ncbi:MAG TPA: flavin reductase family protein [Thermodesulfobacteriota bacterium]|nr:flavin reductase family protein [Thermodesulfobacteriota bacterium]
MDKVKIDNNVFIPMPVTLVGCMLKGKPNFMAVGWVSRVNARPPHIAVAINRSHATPEGIIENRAFSVCFPARDKITEVDYCGMVSGKDTDKSSLFTVFYGDLKTAPMILEASLNLECSLVQTVEGPSNFLFIGEIKGAYASPRCVKDGRIDPRKADYLFLTMPDNTYWSLGDWVGQAWQVGRRLMKT